MADNEVLFNAYKLLAQARWRKFKERNQAEIMIRKSYDTVTEAITELEKLGYTIDFSILTDKECLICHFTATVLSPDDFEIDHFYRFEGDSDPGDEMIVYAISSKKNNLKGIVVNAYGMYAENTSSAIVRKLNPHLNH